ncbi:hypothetical protein M2132_002222 [Dysgonomonas sp. PH5-45]|uniref:hypothetical protein n=1 Tax=unclassified Dysgonomonas TaxID=2630389 RepID=UPI002475AF97|nr:MULTISPECIES: hypothetical protein [unclassified Dysgonomonas]MDH6355872.1 hypothetical protein [Dysgonomonas sp. PH5-45]MDH6388767.1 hypothetical protein [Dysgonomonas sp. PH5-37]
MMDLIASLTELKSKIVLSSKTGGGSGSILKMEIEMNCYLFIYCVWRIEHNNIVLATSDDDSQAQIGRMAKSAKLLENKKVTSLSLSDQYDLTICFDDNYCFRAFCNISYSQTENGGTYDTNWELCLPSENIVFKINNHFKEEMEAYY